MGLSRADSPPVRFISLARPPAFQLGLLLIIALALRLLWLAATQYTYEDAFITFRYAWNLAAGRGFVHNVGEPVYGTTTPLLTLLLAGWLQFSGDVVLGARLIGLTASLGALVLTWLTLGELNLRDARRVIPITILACAQKLWIKDLGGMETPLVMLGMMAVWYAGLRGWPARAGIAAGLLLWTRIDAIVWLFALGLALWVTHRRFPVRFTVSAALTYLPWMIFATLYFGSPIPHTLTAKWAAYFLVNRYSPLAHLGFVISWLTPYTTGDWQGWEYLLVIPTLVFALQGILNLRPTRLFLALPVYWALELARLVLTRETFENRYFMPLWWVTMMLCGVGLGALWHRLTRPTYRRGAVLALMLAWLIGLGLGYQRVPIVRNTQQYRHEAALQAAGLWLNQHTPPGASVLVEPLGYIGYFADRYMLDEVGLVTPRMVALKREGRTTTLAVLPILQPDYVVGHCDDLERWQTAGDAALMVHYRRAAVFNPLNFGGPPPADISSVSTSLQRVACYEIWGPRTD